MPPFAGPYNTVGVTLSSVDVATVEDDGGYRLLLRGTFKNAPCSVALVRGPDEFLCYSGTSGEGYAPLPKNPVIILAVTPRMPRGGAAWDIRVQQPTPGDTGATATLAAAITVVPRVWKTKTFALRSLLPPWYRMGVRALQDEELLT